MPGSGPAARAAVLAAIAVWAGPRALGQVPAAVGSPVLPPPLFQGAPQPGVAGGTPLRPSQVVAPSDFVASAPGLQPLTLNQAIAIALRNSDVVRTVGGGPAVDAGTGFDPQIERQKVTAAEAAFDPYFNAAVDQARYNLPPDSIYGPGLSQPDRRNQANLNANLTKRWGTGALTGVGYNPPTAFLFLPGQPRDVFNPLYSSNLELTVRQPLLRGFGPAVNEAPIRIARISADQTSCDLRAATQQLVRGVEETYWQLFAAGEAAAAAERSLVLAKEIVRIQEERVAVERAVPADVSRARSEVFRFEQMSAEARARVAVAEIRLRDLMGMPVEEGGLIVAASRPDDSPARPDRATALADAFARRPDLVRKRMELERRSVELTVAENARNPQLDLFGLYRTNGVGNSFGDSIQQAGTFGYTDWTAGVQFAIPLGNRAAKSGAKAAELAMARERALLRRTEQAVALEIERLLREIEYTFARYERASWQARENREWLRAAGARFADPPPEDGGEGWLTRSLTELLLAMRTQAESESEAAELLADYGTLLARLEEAKGTILENRAVEVVDEDQPLPSAPAGPPVPPARETTVLRPAAPAPEPISRLAPAPEAQSDPLPSARAVPLPPPAFGGGDSALPSPAFGGNGPPSLTSRAFGGLGDRGVGPSLPPPVYGSAD